MNSNQFIADKFCNAILVLNNGKVLRGRSVGAYGEVSGEVCFNTSMTGYQEILTDPSYASQIITFTFPHVGNVGCNDNDMESSHPHCRGLIIREPITLPSSYRSQESFHQWLVTHNICGISNIDTRALTKDIRKHEHLCAIIYSVPHGSIIDIGLIQQKVKLISDLSGVELTRHVTTKNIYIPTSGTFNLTTNSYEKSPATLPDQVYIYKIVVIDFGIKRNILNCLIDTGFEVVVVPSTSSVDDILKLKPDGIFLSNGPGDPLATLEYTNVLLSEIIGLNIPTFGICLGHQLLSLLFGLKTKKMCPGHRGANHPVRNNITDKVEISSQNHSFCVITNLTTDLDLIQITHTSLFDQTIEGIRLKDKPIFSVQYHPESSPGPHDSKYLFKQFYLLVKEHKERLTNGKTD